MGKNNPVNALKNNDVTFSNSTILFPIDKLISDGFQFDTFLNGEGNRNLPE